MKVITEAILRSELRASTPETYTVPEGKILSPAAREYLQQCKIRIEDGKGIKTAKKSQQTEEREEKPEMQATKVLPMPEVQVEKEAKPKFVDYETGAYYYEKPEHMTHLYGNTLVPKDPLTEEEMQKIATLERNNRLVKGQVFLWEGAKDWHDLWDEEGKIVTL